MIGAHSFKYHNNSSLTLRPTMSSRAVWVLIFSESYLLTFPSRCCGRLTIPSLPASIFITQLLCVLHLAACMDICIFLQNITYGWLGHLTQRCLGGFSLPYPKATNNWLHWLYELREVWNFILFALKYTAPKRRHLRPHPHLVPCSYLYCGSLLPYKFSWRANPQWNMGSSISVLDSAFREVDIKILPINSADCLMSHPKSSFSSPQNSFLLLKIQELQLLFWEQMKRGKGRVSQRQPH